MKQIVLISGALYAMLSVVLGAFGAHAFKDILIPRKLESFNTAVHYQMYHALALLIMGFALSFSSPLERWSGICIMIGVFLFSFSIYFLVFSEYWNVNLRFLGPVTPIGGLFMIMGWLLLVVYFIKNKIA